MHTLKMRQMVVGVREVRLWQHSWNETICNLFAKRAMCSGSVRKVEAAAKGVAIDQRQWLRHPLRLELHLQLLLPFAVHLKPKLWQKPRTDLRPENSRPGARVSRYSDTDTDGAPPSIRNTHTHTAKWGGKGDAWVVQGSWGNRGCAGIHTGWVSLLLCSLKTFKV